jgi:hypothetical protein
MHHSIRAGLVIALLASACTDRPDVRLPADPTPLTAQRAIVPADPLVTIPVGTGSARIWSYLSDDLVTAQDPVNLIFTGSADPRAIRNALLGLDDARGAPFPPVFPFTCTWSDAIGGLMAGYSENAGWGGDAVQLQCGRYGPIRFHLRLFKMGSYTLGNGHFELLIPGTTDHQVLSWELAEQLVTYDMARTGLLGAAPTSTGLINAAPSHRAIPAVIYNGLPPDLRALIGGPAADVSAGVGIGTDGRATSFLLIGEAPEAAPISSQHEVIPFSQVIPKPFCASGPADYVLAQGPITLDQSVTTLPGGELRQVFHADGDLLVIPLDIFTGLPSGEPMTAKVSEDQDTRAGAEGGRINGLQQQRLLPASSPDAGSLRILFNVTPGQEPRFVRSVICK